MKKFCIGFCFQGESYFETDHPNYNSRSKALYASITEILDLLKLCVDQDCELYINIPIKRKLFFQTQYWRQFEIEGVDGKQFTMRYNERNGFSEKSGVSLDEIEKEIRNLKPERYRFSENGWKNHSV